jgi:hypothetical protein
MDWSALLGLLAFLLFGGGAAYFSYAFATRTRNVFRAHQPDVRLTNLSAMTSGDTLTLSPELENIGGGVAYGCTLQLGGWEGHFAVAHVYPRGPRSQKQTISIVLGPDAPIRCKPLSNGYLRLSYRDRWGLTYECWYPVVQQGSSNSPLYDVHVDLTRADITEPRLSIWEMWKLLRTKSPRT